jgi:hypothetical protein
MRDDWRWQRDEPPRAHALFEQYLAQGPRRRLRDLARARGLSYSYLKKLSHLWRWRERAAGWQVTVQQAGEVNAVDLAAEARQRQIRDAQMMMQLARAELARWFVKDREGTLRRLRSLTPHQAARFWQVGYRVEHSLLPPAGPDPPAEVKTKLSEARYQQEEDDEEKPAQQWDLLEEIAKLVRLLRQKRMSPKAVQEHHARLLRWLWLPEEKSLSLEAIGKANRTRSLREGCHASPKTKKAARA